jgi:hypothetical protein
MSTSPSKKTVNAARLALGLGPARDSKAAEEAQPTVAAARETLFTAAAQPPTKKLGVVEVSETGELLEPEFYGTYRRVPTSASS